MGDAFHVGDWSVYSASGRITRDGESVKLEPRVMEVLVYLASRQGEVVSRQELEETLWAGTVVSYDALTGAIQKLRRAFKDDRKEPRVIETLSKRGYRLVAPVYPLVAPEGDVRSTVGDTVPAKEVRWGQVTAIAALAALAVVAFFLWSVPREQDTHLVADDGAKRSIAVLPFDSLSGDSTALAAIRVRTISPTVSRTT